MRIGIDARLWPHTGIGRYIRNICINLQEIDKKNDYVLFIRKEDRKDVEEKINDKNWKIVSVNIPWHSIREQITFLKIINKENLDLVHFTYQQSVPVFYKKPYVMTIHDLIKHHFITGKASDGPIWLYGFKMIAYKSLINLASRNAAKIIAVSNFTRDDIFDHLIVNKKNVEVIYEAANDLKISKEKINIGKYFLFVGNVYQHKNVDSLIKAFKLISENENVKLVFIGKEDYFYTRLKKSTSRLVKEGRVIFLEDVDDNELATYYANAICLVRSSYMEGFSLPPLEAMQSGGLVLGSDIPVHREIFGDNIFYFNPKDYVDLGNKMLYVLNLSSAEREKRIKSGQELAKKFSWEKAARETLKLYESCASSSSV